MGGTAGGRTLTATGRSLAAVEADLTARRAPYATATVVWTAPPTSAKPGARAVIEADGTLTGWVGGSCAEPGVVRQALLSLAEGRPRLLHVGPPGVPDRREGVVGVPVGCRSEGESEVFIEPHLPAPLLCAVGRAPVVDTLVTLAGAVGFDTAAVDVGTGPELDLAAAGVGPGAYVVVATFGRYDEDAVAAALRADAGYVALVASAKRAATVLEFLRADGVAEADLARLHAPAGLDLGPLPHREIAVAILAEIVALKAARPPVVAGPPEPAPTAEAVDPVCGMSVAVSASTERVTRDGTTWYFCSAGCRRSFAASTTAG